jgi:hypothetical protein
MGGTGNLVVRTDGGGARQALADLVMAWARDSATGEPRYILELSADRRGAKSGCECASCGLPLTAVNAAKAEFVKRPHFRHPEGAERDECMVLAARAAALRTLHVDGWLELPRRRRSARAVGLSGDIYEAWVETPPEKLHITEVDYRDHTTAVITFDDGRQLRVELTGTPGDGDGPVGADGLPVPTILLAVDDPAVAALSPDELRRRLTLLPDGICWRGHWEDAELQTRADAEARERALPHFDEVPEGLVLPVDMAPTLKRETVLHHEVKRLLAEAGKLAVPGLEVEEAVPAPDGRTLHGRWSVPSHVLEVSHVELEERFGSIIPDVTCKAWSEEGGRTYWPLLVEVTVTNPIDDERLQRIRQAGQAALEIDLSLAGGRVTRDELRQLVVEEVATKRWLFHPDQEEQRFALLSRLEQQAQEEQAALDEHARQAIERARLIEERRQRVLAAPVAQFAAEYLDAVIAMQDAMVDTDADDRQYPRAKMAERAARERVAEAADALTVHGYPEAGDENLIDWRGILARILSLQLGRVVGYKLDNAMAVLNAIRQSTGVQRSNHTLYLIAARVYRPKLMERQQTWFEDWAEEVKSSIRAGEKTYLRDPTYDRILSLLFPEMGDALAKPAGKLNPADALSWDANSKTFHRQALPQRRRAGFIATQPKADLVRGRLLDTKAR